MTDDLAIYLFVAGCAVFGIATSSELEAGSYELAVVGSSTQHLNTPQVCQHAAEAEEPIATEFGSTRLTGILTVPGRRIAIFTVPGVGSLELTEGQILSGWKIENITPSGVLLKGPGGKRLLQPERDAAPAPEAPELTFHRVLPDQQTRDEE